jgi:uncharacterized membrane protein YphA (DoxX/SURF4 family)
MRLAAGGFLVASAAAEFTTGPPAVLPALAIAACASGLLLVLGLWTPLAALTAAATSAWGAASGSHDPTIELLLTVVCVALALLGPGAWSIDSRLFGWRRLEIRNGRASTAPPPADDPSDSPRP